MMVGRTQKNTRHDLLESAESVQSCESKRAKNVNRARSVLRAVRALVVWVSKARYSERKDFRSLRLLHRFSRFFRCLFQRFQILPPAAHRSYPSFWLGCLRSTLLQILTSAAIAPIISPLMGVLKPPSQFTANNNPTPTVPINVNIQVVLRVGWVNQLRSFDMSSQDIN